MQVRTAEEDLKQREEADAAQQKKEEEKRKKDELVRFIYMHAVRSIKVTYIGTCGL